MDSVCLHMARILYRKLAASFWLQSKRISLLVHLAFEPSRFLDSRTMWSLIDDNMDILHATINIGISNALYFSKYPSVHIDDP